MMHELWPVTPTQTYDNYSLAQGKTRRIFLNLLKSLIWN